MALKNVVGKIKRTLLCCRKRQRKHSLDIGSPTDVRQLDITETMNLTEAHAKIIRETSSSTTHLLLSLSSHPPTSSSPSTPFAPTTPPTNPFASQHHLPPSPSSSLRSSHPSPLPNAASSNLPATIPTPPRQVHSANSPPAYRVKSMWERAQQSDRDTVSRGSSITSGASGKGEGVMMLELDLGKRDEEEEWEVQSVIGGTPEKGVRGVVVRRDVKVGEEWEVQSVIGGTPEKGVRGVVVRRDVKVGEEGENGSESEGEMERLVGV